MIGPKAPMTASGEVNGRPAVKAGRLLEGEDRNATGPAGRDATGRVIPGSDFELGRGGFATAAALALRAAWRAAAAAKRSRGDSLDSAVIAAAAASCWRLGPGGKLLPEPGAGGAPASSGFQRFLGLAALFLE